MAGTYRTGTVTLANGSAVVTGAGTAFLANVTVGDIFHLTTEDVPYIVAAIATDTQLNLSAPYAGAGGAGLAYEITRDFTSLGIPIPQRGDLSPWAVLAQMAGKINSLFGQVGASLGIVAGDLIFGSGPNTLARLAAATNGFALKLIDGLPSWQPSREVLTANRTYYVRSDGADTNTGLVDSAGGAFATLQAAFKACLKLDFNGFDVTLSATLGTALAGVAINKPWVGGNLNISLAAGVIVAAPSRAIDVSAFGGILSISGAGKLTSLGNGVLILNSAAGLVNFSGIEFGSTTGVQILSNRPGAQIAAIGPYSISGSSVTHIQTSGNGYVEVVGRTVTLAGGTAFTSAFAVATNFSSLRASANTFIGAASGKRYIAQLASALFTFGSTLPGDQAGTVDASSFVN